MANRFKKVLLGYKPAEVESEINKIQTEKQKEIENYQAQIKEAEAQIKKQEEVIVELRKRLEEFADKQRVISEVMIIAQKNAFKVKEDAEEKARNMLDESEEKVRIKTQELERLRAKVSDFKEEFQRILEKYQASLEELDSQKTEPFVPTVIFSKK